VTRIILASFIIMVFSGNASADTLSGTPRIVDGDTIHIDQTKIRLHGIDTPETSQECINQAGESYSCGEAATAALRTLIGSQSVRCEGSTYDRYKRLIAICYSGSINVNEEMVRLGWALAYRKYSMDYVEAEVEAQSEGRGLWAGEFEMPWDWRRK
jgi:endonuclease YncB( thermonuclease family)